MKIPSLQALRALAALMVVVFHGQSEVAALAARTQRSFTPSALLPWEAGVDVFFVISGFIIVHAAAPLFGVADGRRRFLAHRVARVVPLYWLVTAVYLAVAVATPSLLSSGPGADGIDPAYVAASFLFWPMARPDGTPVPLYSLGWTLNYEMFFYGLFAIGLGWGRRAALAWLLASLVLLAAAHAAFPPMPMPLSFWTSPLPLEFAFGALLALGRGSGVRLGTGLRMLMFGSGLVALALAPTPDAVLRPVAWGVPAALIVASAAVGSDDARAWTSVWGRTLSAVGDASYALYLTHPFVLRGGREALVRLDLASGFDPWAALVLLTVSACLGALAVHRLVEKPLSSWARVLLDPGSRKPPAKALDGTGATVPAGRERV